MPSDPVSAGFYRDQALRHYFRDPGSRGVLPAAAPWSTGLLLVSAILAVAAGFFAGWTEIEVHARIECLVQTTAKSGAASDGQVVVATVEAGSGRWLQLGTVRVDGGVGPREGRLLASYPDPAQPSRLLATIVLAPDAADMQGTPDFHAGQTLTLDLRLGKRLLIGYLFDPDGHPSQ